MKSKAGSLFVGGGLKPSSEASCLFSTHGLIVSVPPVNSIQPSTFFADDTAARNDCSYPGWDSKLHTHPLFLSAINIPPSFRKFSLFLTQSYSYTFLPPWSIHFFFDPGRACPCPELCDFSHRSPSINTPHHIHPALMSHRSPSSTNEGTGTSNQKKACSVRCPRV